MQKCICGKPATQSTNGDPRCDHCTAMLEQMYERNRANADTPRFPVPTFPNTLAEQMKIFHERWLANIRPLKSHQIPGPPASPYLSLIRNLTKEKQQQKQGVTK
jgi:hypothetical protein